MKGQTAILYVSKTGFTRRYAQWIAQRLGARALPFSRGNARKAAGNETILFGSSLHAGRIRKAKWLKRRLPGWRDKRIVLFVTGAMPDGPDAQNTLRQNFTGEEWAAIKAFYLPGGLCYERMGWFDRMMMAGFRRFLQKSQPDGEAARMVAHSYDLSNEGAIENLTRYCNSDA